MWDIAAREFVGNNLPHILITRTSTELIEQTVNQLGNSIGFFGTGLGLNNLINLLLRNQSQHQTWFSLGKSFSIYSIISALMLAIPFLRNFITIKNTGKTSFISMVGEQNKPVTPKERNKELNKNWHIFKNIMLSGMLLSIGTLGLTHLAIQRKFKMPKPLQILNKKLSLKNGDFKNFHDLAAFVFWTVPIYSGFWLSCRDNFERKEIALRFFALLSSFYLLPRASHFLVRRLGKGKENMAYASHFLTSTVLCGITPSFVNIYLTHLRVRTQQLKNQEI